MKKNSLMFVLTFLLGAAVLLFLLGLKGRNTGAIVVDEKKETPRTQTTVLIQEDNPSASNVVAEAKVKVVPNKNTTTTTLRDKRKVTSEKFNKESICPLIEKNVGRNALIQKLKGAGIKTSELKTMRRNIHIVTEDDKKLRLAFSRKEQDNLSSKLILKVLEEKEDASFLKVTVPEEYKTSNNIASILKHYNSKEITYKEEVNVFDSDDLEILFESLDDKVISFNALTRDFSNTFSCRFKK